MLPRFERLPSWFLCRFRLILVLLAILTPAASHAEPDPQTPKVPGLVAPQAINAGVVPYPEGALGDDLVVVELVVDTQGSVTDVRILQGTYPFTRAVEMAAPSWRFIPATRGDVAVVARIKMRVDFTAPHVGPEDDIAETESTPWTRSDPAPPLEAEPEDEVPEVTVRGAHDEVGKMSMGGGEVRQIPGAFGDAFRAIEALPGVTPIFSGIPFYFVRGAPPGNMGSYFDGIRVPLLYHLGVGAGVINPAVVDRVDLYSGAYPAKYGTFAGGILNGTMRAPAERLHGEGAVRLIDVAAMVESPLAEGRGSVLASGRYGFPGLVISLITPNVTLNYWDYQARATWKLTPKDEIGLFVFGSYDYLGTRESKQQSFTTAFETQFHRVDFRYDRAVGRQGRLRVALTGGFERSGSEAAKSTDFMVAARTELDLPLSQAIRLRAGGNVTFDHRYFRSAATFVDATDAVLFPDRNDITFGAWTDVVLRISKRIEVIPGLRLDTYGTYPYEVTNSLVPVPPSALQPAFDPRLATRVRFTDWFTWLTGFGIAHQAPSFFLPIPGFQIAASASGLQTAIQTSQGFEIALPADFTLTTTGFYHAYRGLNDLTAGLSVGDADFDFDSGGLDSRVTGRAYGLELLLRRDLTKKVTGWLSYTLSRSTRQTFPNGRLNAPIEILSEFDRTHVLNVIGAVDLGRRWRIGGRLLFYSGRPYSKSVNGQALAPYNNERLPVFFRFDVRVEKSWPFGNNGGRVTFVADILNATLTKEAVSASCNPNTPGLAPTFGDPESSQSSVAPTSTCSVQKVGPVTLPILGVEVVF